MNLDLLAVNTGIPRTVGCRSGVDVRSAIAKSPVLESRIYVATEGIMGDVQANRSVHGGKDQALCAYSADHWHWWMTEKDLRCRPGSFGENLTLRGADENTVTIGDRFELDGVVLEVTQPRGPCTNIDLHHARTDLATTMTLSGRCGWYFRVIREGWVSTETKLLRRILCRNGPTVRDAFEVRYDARASPALRQRVHGTPELAENWRRAIALPVSK